MRPDRPVDSSITEAVKAAGSAGIDLTEVLQFSRHSRLDTLMVYRDQLRNVQGTLAAAVASTAAPTAVTSTPHRSETRADMGTQPLAPEARRATFERELASIKARLG